MYKFSNKSQEQLKTCHPLLQLILREAIKITDFSVIEGTRDEAKQNEFYAQGWSKVKYPNGRHNKNPSQAVDIRPYPFKGWDNLGQFYELAGVIKTIAVQQNIKIKWGGDFKEFFDGQHFELKDVYNDEFF